MEPNCRQYIRTPGTWHYRQCQDRPIEGSQFCWAHQENPVVNIETLNAATLLNELLGVGSVSVGYKGDLILSPAAAEKIATALRKEPQ